MDDRYRKVLYFLQQQHENFNIEEIQCIERAELVPMYNHLTFL